MSNVQQRFTIFMYSCSTVYVAVTELFQGWTAGLSAYVDIQNVMTIEDWTAPEPRMTAGLCGCSALWCSLVAVLLCNNCGNILLYDLYT